MTEETEFEYESILDGKSPIDRIKQLAENYNETCYDIGCILYHLKENDTYKTINGTKYYSDNHSKWKLFCEENLSISYRTAQYWLNLYRYFVVDMGMSKDGLKGMGWAKAKELIDITDDVDVLTKFVNESKDKTINELKASITDYQKKDGQDTRDVVTFKAFNFRLPAIQAEHAAEIIAIAQQQCNGDLNEGFWKVLIEWYQSNLPVKSTEDKETFLEKDEEIFEVI